MKQTTKSAKPKITVERKEMPVAALWAGAIIAPILCVTSVLELLVGANKMSILGISWTVFVIGFTAFYSYDFAKQLRVRRETSKLNMEDLLKK